MEVNRKLFELAEEINKMLLKQRPGMIFPEDIAKIQTWLFEHGTPDQPVEQLADRYMRDRSQITTVFDKLNFVKIGIWVAFEITESEVRILLNGIERLERLAAQRLRKE